MIALPTGVPRSTFGFTDNKAIPINRILGITIKKFRTIEGAVVRLGSNVTVLSGRNGTMKTSIMGLIAHPFTSDAKDAFGKTLKTTLSEVFRFSTVHDVNEYEYGLVLDVGQQDPLTEPVKIYAAVGTNRHRVVVSGSEKGDGNFSYNTSFLNLKRLYPIVDTNAKNVATGVKLSAAERAGIKDFFEQVFPASDYDKFEPVFENNVKTTFALTGTSTKYDWSAISSGEDNLGAFFNRLLGFQRAYTAGQTTGNGILCIDEFESALHPVAQIRLFKYLLSWSEKYKVQVLISTHSLYLIQYLYSSLQKQLDKNKIVINFISKAQATNGNYPIHFNPPFALAYKQLTLEDPIDAAAARRVRVLCEDDVAVHFLKRLIQSQKVLRAVELVSSLKPDSGQPGTSYSALRKLCVEFPLLIENALVVFDGDVAETVTNDIGKKVRYLKLPDADGYAIERRIMLWILQLSADDPFFEHSGKEQETFMAQFKDAGLKSLTPDDVKDEAATPIKQCKGWVQQDKVAFRTYVSYYAKTAPGRKEFATAFLSKVNAINGELGVPPIVI